MFASLWPILNMMARFQKRSKACTFKSDSKEHVKQRICLDRAPEPVHSGFSVRAEALTFVAGSGLAVRCPNLRLHSDPLPIQAQLICSFERFPGGKSCSLLTSKNMKVHRSERILEDDTPEKAIAQHSMKQ